MDIIPSVTIPLEVVAHDMIPALLDLALKSAVVLAVALAVVHFLRQSSAAVRHMVWAMAFGALAALPVLTAVGPKWTVPTIDWAVRAADVTAGGPTPSVASDLRPVGPAARIAAAGVQAVPAEGVPNGPADAVAASPQLRVDATTWLLLIWATGCAAVLLTLLAGQIRVRWLAKTARVVRGGTLRDLVDDLSGELGLRRPVTLLVSNEHPMPMTWGTPPKVLIPADADDWTDARLRAVLLHELAHVKRADYYTQLLARLVCAVHWFNPLVWLAAHRLRVERERACDDYVLNGGSRPSDYAQHLLDVARSLRAGAMTAVVGVPMARRSQLSDRLHAVLDDSRRRSVVTRGTAASSWLSAALITLPVAGATAATEQQAEVPRRGATTAAAVAAPTMTSDPQPLVVSPMTVSTGLSPQAPAPPTLCDWTAKAENTSSSSNIDDDEMRVRIKRDDCRLDIEAVGRVEFNADETDILSLSRGGYFEIEERDGRSRRKVEIRSSASGVLEHRWFVDGDRQAFGDDARQWLARILPMVFRTTGIQAEERAARILTSRGVDGLLREIALIRSDHVARKYYTVLVTQGNLTSAQLRSVVRQAGTEISSDFELAELLTGIAASSLMDDQVMLAYVEAAGTISSDFEQRRVLRAVLGRPGLDRSVADAMLAVATEISSDFELAELLIELVRIHPASVALTPRYFEAVSTINSDFEHRRVLIAILDQGAPDLEVLDRTLASATAISSDFELAELLRKVADLYPIDRAMPPSYLAAARTVSSDHELGRVLGRVIERGHLSQASLADVLAATGTIDSDHELAALLTDVARRYQLDGTARAAFFRALGTVQSDFEHARVLKAVIAESPLSDELVEDLLASALAIDSDHEQAGLLLAVARKFPIGDRLMPAFVRAADTINSSYERDRVLAALK